MNKLFTKPLIVEVVAVATLCCSALATAATLELPTVPLISSASSSVKPNLMLLLDSSGSMSNIVPDAPYDENIDYFNCTETLSASASIDIRIQSDGDVYFNNYDFGTNNSTGITGRTQKCFIDDASYSARLLGEGSGTKSPSSYLSATYKGNYLNWYFSNSTQSSADNFGSGATRKPGTKTRLEIAQTAANTLINDLVGMHVGLSIYNGGNGAKILANLASIETSSEKKILTDTISLIENGGMTPLAESLQDLGRYFTTGVTGNLTLHPGESNEESSPASTVFNHTPSGLSAPATVITNWCQQSFIVAMTDGRPTEDANISSLLQDYDGDCVNASCGNYDKKTSGGYSYESNAHSSDYADDVIKAMYDMDLRPDFTQEKNNITTYVIGFADASLGSDKLMLDMAAAGGGGDLLSAANSAELVAAFKQATNSIAAKAGARSAVSFNGSQLSSDSALYQASFNSGGWIGHLKAFALSDTGTIADDATWDAATKLDAMTYTDRNIFTYNSTGVEFTQANLNTAQLNDLKKGPEGNSDANVLNLINYIKGDRSNEATATYRTRTQRLGDIVNSSAIYVGAPELNWPSFASNSKFGATGDDYSTFKSGTAATRTPMLYVGANDGMLHGFNGSISGTDAGKEKLAYIPGMVFSDADNAGLHYLAQNDYAHRFYVDLTPTVSDVYIKGRELSKAWRSVLIGGLRSGGKGLFALDITDPTKFSSSAANAEKLALWEFSSANDVDFGYSYSQPTVAMMGNGKWAVIVGNGYNNSGDGNAKLFILFIDEGADGTWSSADYVKIDTGIGSTVTPNGLSTPTVVDSDSDGVADRIYAGDLQGNMWAFDVTGNNWGVAYKQGTTPKPLFTATDGSKAQPITSAPTVIKNPTTGSGSNLLVLFGTGKYLEKNDKTTKDIMSYYSVLDVGSGELSRSDLTPRELITYDGDLRTLNGSSWSGTKGWYIDLVKRTTTGANGTTEGERVVADSIIRKNILFFNTMIPTVTTVDPCSPSSSGWLMSVDLSTGLAPTYAVFDANKDGTIDKTSGSGADTNGDGVVDGGDTGYIGQKFDEGTPSESGFLGDKQYVNGSNGELVERETYTGSDASEGRLSWEEMTRE